MFTNFVEWINNVYFQKNQRWSRILVDRIYYYFYSQLKQNAVKFRSGLNKYQYLHFLIKIWISWVHSINNMNRNTYIFWQEHAYNSILEFLYTWYMIRWMVHKVHQHNMYAESMEFALKPQNPNERKRKKQNCYQLKVHIIQG